jgi:SAM-dependent methyltransferase
VTALPALDDILACPRCKGRLTAGPGTLRSACGGEFPVIAGIPRLADGAGGRDPRVAAELEAQRHAHPLYVDDTSLMNHWEALVLPRIAAALAGIDGRVLDLGCGVGRFGRTWAAEPRAAELYGMDLVIELLAEARVGYAGLFEGDVHRLPIVDGAFSAVVIANALHHIADPVHALREVRRILRPGGVVIGYDPRELAPIELVKRVVRRGNDAFGEHHRAFTVADYRALFAEAGFEVTRFAAVDPVGPLVATGLDLLGAGRLGIAAPIARALAGIDAAVARVDPTGRLGLMLLVEART